MFGLFCMSPFVFRLQHCGVLTHVNWTGLWVSKRPVVPALSLSIYLFLLLPQLQLWNCRCHFLPTVQRLRLRLHLCLSPAPAPYADAIVESATQKIFLSPPSSVLAVFFFTAVIWPWFHVRATVCCMLPQCWWIIGRAHLQPDCSAARPSPRVRIRQLYCADANEANEAQRAAKQFNDSGVLHLKHAWSARCGGLDKLVNTIWKR